METIELPITLSFDSTKVIGHVIIDKKYLDVFPHMILSPAIIKQLGSNKNELNYFGLVPTKSFIEAFNNF